MLRSRAETRKAMLADSAILRKIEKQPKRSAGFKQLVKELGLGKRRGDDAESQLSEQALAQRAQLMLERIAIAEDAVGPVEHPLALGGKSLEPLAAFDDGNAELGFELADGGGKSRLRDIAALGGAAEMLLARQGDQITEMPKGDHETGKN